MFKFNLFESKYFPLLCVFLSGLGFSIQILVVRMLAFRHFSASLTLIFYRALIQMLFCATVMYHNHRKQYPNGPKIFGDNRWTSFLLVCRGLIGFVGIVFGLMAAEKLPIGDATVILMLGPTVASVAGIIFLGEPWMLAECIGTVLSLVGVTLVSRPSFIFGGVSESLSTIGVIFAIINSFASGAVYIIIRILGTTAKVPWPNVAFAQGIVAATMSYPCALAIPNEPFRFNLSSYQYGFIFMAASVGAVSQNLMTYGLQREKSATATAMRMSDVVFGFLWQAIFTSDNVNAFSVVGALLVMSSILIVVYNKASRESMEPQNQGGEKEENLVVVPSSHDIEEGTTASCSNDTDNMCRMYAITKADDRNIEDTSINDETDTDESNISMDGLRSVSTAEDISIQLQKVLSKKWRLKSLEYEAAEESEDESRSSHHVENFLMKLKSFSRQKMHEYCALKDDYE